MLITYGRSSSLNNYSYCQMQYFITYVLGHVADSGKKAEMGTIVHKALEVLASFKKSSQTNITSTYIEAIDDSLGIIKIERSDLLSDHVIDDIFEKSFSYYVDKSKHSWTAGDKKECLRLIRHTLSYNDGQYDPRLRNIIDTEPHFDIPITEDWAKYEYEINGEVIKGTLAIKGTIDLVTKVSDDVIEVIDWKGLSVDTPIPTVDGWTTMGELKVGDSIFDQNGNITKVLEKSSRTVKQCYKITFDDNSTVICDNEHLWKLDTGKIVPITDLKVKNKINVSRPLKIETPRFPICPYSLGKWLCGKKINSATTSKINRTLGSNKRIPMPLLRSSLEERLKLLMGIMDSRGSCNLYKNQAVFNTYDKELSEDVFELLLTLGQKPSQFVIIRKYQYQWTPSYQIRFHPFLINPFKKHKHADKIDKSWGQGRASRRLIRKIEKIGSMETQCIMVDSPTSTYLCTKNMIPTHNTGKRLDWATGEEKTQKKLETDVQLLLYNYAISKLYPDFSQAILSIFFVKDGGPFSMCFDNSDHDKFLSILKDTYEKIKRNNTPLPISKNRDHWKCTKLCHFCKNKWPNSEKNICVYVEDHLNTHGMQKTIENCTRDGFHIGHYSSPGQ